MKDTSLVSDLKASGRMPAAPTAWKPAQQVNGQESATVDYQRIEKAIFYLADHFLEQPDLAAAAHAAHLSPYHFQRIFTRWAGVSPKRFLQFLTLEHAKMQLAHSTAVLDAALDSGLSGPSRLHDLFVSAEAVTPGEFKSRGAGVEIRYGVHPTPFGPCLLGLTERGICWLSFSGHRDDKAAVSEMRSRWSGARLREGPKNTKPVADRIFSRFEAAGRAPLNLLLMGTNFQLKVWEALLRVPPGSVVSYRTVSRALGMPKATRAVGSAVASNSIAYLIPCHRVIRQSGVLGGYRWGQARKQAMLALEAATHAG